MTEKDLHKLRRQDLLQLLLAQSREVAGQQERIRELEDSEASLQALSERLKGKLNEKDALIEKLKGRLDEKDFLIAELREGGLFEVEKDGETCLVPMRLEELFSVAHRAAEAYLREKKPLEDSAGKEKQ